MNNTLCKRVDKVCEQCGEMMLNVTHNTRFCPACRRKRQMETNAAYRAKTRGIGSVPRRKRTNENGQVSKYCEGCGHLYSERSVNRCCNYIFDMGHSRGCPAGQGCTKKTKKTTNKNKRRFIL